MPKKQNGFVKLFKETKTLLRNIPALLLTIFIISIVCMNLFANKSINTGVEWLALDCGIFFSWMCFLTMDIIAKRFGVKAANIISIFGLAFNLFLALMFFIVSIIPGTWSESYIEGSEAVINIALDQTFRGTWYIILGSSVAFFVSAIVNNLLNGLIGKIFNRNSKEEKMTFLEFSLRSYISTMIGQFVDNSIFAFMVGMVFFNWTVTQCFVCASVGAVAELLCEIIFSPLGYKIVLNMKKREVGKEYLELISSEENKQ